MDEFEINDYPQIARQKISHREPLDHIKEMTGATSAQLPMECSPPQQRKLQHGNAGPHSIVETELNT
eukprot:3361915-Amphidinium_carterae.1